MVCNHMEIKVKSSIIEGENFNEKFTLLCCECNKVLYSNIDYNDYIDTINKEGLMLTY